MSIFNDLFDVKQSPILSMLGFGGGGTGSALGGAASIPVVASGGTKRTFGEYSFHVFPGAAVDGGTTPYNFTVNSGGGSNATFDIILVAGGGGGGDDSPGSYGGGGGGAGGVRFIPEITLDDAPFALTVGGGGSNTNPGADTTFNPGDGNSVPAIQVKGGGRGGDGNGSNGAPGGSGGGKDYPGNITTFGTGNAGAGNVGEPRASGPTSPIGDTQFQGSPGNARANDTPYSGGGGGGARYAPNTYYTPPITGPGIVVTASNPNGASYRAQGGDGIDFSPIIGAYPVNGNYGDSSPRAQPGAWFGGGGHGGVYPGGPGAPGTGGIGGGGYDNPGSPWTGHKDSDAVVNTGGGGGTAYGKGGPGILIVRYKTTGGPTGSS